MKEERVCREYGVELTTAQASEGGIPHMLQRPQPTSASHLDSASRKRPEISRPCKYTRHTSLVALRAFGKASALFTLLQNSRLSSARFACLALAASYRSTPA